jgi:hypothetical protein
VATDTLSNLVPLLQTPRGVRYLAKSATQDDEHISNGPLRERFEDIMRGAQMGQWALAQRVTRELGWYEKNATDAGGGGPEAAVKGVLVALGLAATDFGHGDLRRSIKRPLALRIGLALQNIACHLTLERLRLAFDEGEAER